MADEGLNLAILISGRGSNMRALVRACRDRDFPAQVSVVVVSNPDAAGLSAAQGHGIPTEVVDCKDYPDRAAFETALQETLAGYPVDVICLAGFMRVLSADFIKNWTDRIINIHPSLLPDYKGLNTHARVLADQKKESGCTVHFVTAELDAGPVILQKKVKVMADDTEETLAARVLEQEHIAYPEAVNYLASNVKNRKKQA